MKRQSRSSSARPGHLRLLLATGACAILLSACQRDPNVARQAYFDAGNKYFAQQKYDEAVIEYRNAIKHDPKFGEARYRLGQAYARIGDPQNAFREYIRAADLLPGNVDVQLMAGRFLLIRGQFEDARGRAQRVLDRDRRNIDAQILLGNALAGLRDLDGAITEMQTALEIDPTRAGIYTTLGQMQRAQGDVKTAEATFKKAVAAAPKSVNAHLALGNFDWSVGHLADAEASFKQATAISAADPLANRALATLYLSTRRPAEAEPYMKAMAADAKDAAAQLRLADYYIGMSRFDDATRILTGVTGNPAVHVKAEIRIAAIDYALGRRDQAFSGLEQVLKTDPNNAEALLIKGRLLLIGNKVDEALTAVKASVNHDSNAASAYHTLGTIYVRRHQYAEATTAFNEALKLRPGETNSRLQLAQIALNTGASDRAVQLAAEAVVRSPGDVGARIVLTRALIVKGDLPAAQRQVDGLSAAFPNAAAIQALKGALLAMKHDDQAARTAFARALELDTDNIDAFGGLAALDGRSGKLDDAIARIDERLAQNKPDNVALLMLAAQMHAAAHDLPKAEQSLRKVIDTAPSNLTAYSMLAQLYIAQNRLDAALAEFDAIGQRHPEEIGARTMGAVLLELQGHTEQARERYEAILATDPRSAVAANNLAWYYTEHGANLDTALQLAQTAKAMLPDLAPVNDTLGWIYYKKGLAALAIPPLEQSVGANPKNPMYRYHLGLAYAQSGAKDKARAAFGEVIRLKPGAPEAGDAKKALATL